RRCASCAIRPAASTCARSSTNDGKTPAHAGVFVCAATTLKESQGCPDPSHVASAGHSPVVSGVLGVTGGGARAQPQRAGLAGRPPATAPGHRRLLAALRVP